MGLGDWSNVIAGERAELFGSLRRSEEPAVVSNVYEPDDVALVKFQLVGVPRMVVEQRTQPNNKIMFTPFKFHHAG